MHILVAVCMCIAANNSRPRVCGGVYLYIYSCNAGEVDVGGSYDWTDQVPAPCLSLRSLRTWSNHGVTAIQGDVEYLFCGLVIGWLPGGSSDRREKLTAPALDAPPRRPDTVSCGAVLQQLRIEGQFFRTVDDVQRALACTRNHRCVSLNKNY